MNLRMLTVLGAMIGGLVVTACEVNTTNGTGGSGGSAGGETGGGGTGGTAGGMGVGGAGGGGAPGCLKCGEYSTDFLAGTMSTLCPDDPATMTTSTTLFNDLITCACSQGCANDCADQAVCAGANPTSDACKMCIQTGACSAAFGTCSNDF